MEGPWQAIAERLLKVCKESVNENQGRRRVTPARDWDREAEGRRTREVLIFTLNAMPGTFFP